MHQSFTGNARKARQVNLSGRNSVNPWANGSGAAKSFGIQNTVAQAQADRARRQLERDRSNAARNIQRVWRGYKSRKQQRGMWREQWDRNETTRLHRQKSIVYEEELSNMNDVAYREVNDLTSQLVLLVKFLNVKDQLDSSRLQYFGMALGGSTKIIPQTMGTIWSASLRKLAQELSKVLAFRNSKNNSQISTIRLLRTAAMLVEISPLVALDADVHFSSLRQVIRLDSSEEVIQAAAEYVRTILRAHQTGAKLSDIVNHIYIALATQLFCGSELAQMRDPGILFPNFESRVSFYKAVANLPSSQQSSSDDKLWLLAYLIQLWRSTSGSQGVIDWIRALSLLLSQCANQIAARIDILDQPMTGSDADILSPLDQFLKDQISWLPQQQSVVFIMDQLKLSGSTSSRSTSDVAKPLANYAVALLRAFPQRATNIRMWLYRNSPAGMAVARNLSTIQYLWQASQNTSVFLKVSRDQHDVLSVLTEARPETFQIGRAAISPKEYAIWQEDWRIVLLFLELYTFILKLMDDEEFFALDNENKIGRLANEQSTMSQSTQGALPLNDIAKLTTFLKNLAFSLYWNAADLVDTNEIEDTDDLSALFGTVSSSRPSEKKKHNGLAGNDVSHAYLKGLVTGLLRMLHERDTRRRFLPENYWLMTSHFDLQGFIPDVVAEEAKRHEEGAEIADDDDPLASSDLEDDDHSMNDLQNNVLPSIETLFGHRAPHFPRSRNNQAAERMAKRREQARKRRQLQSLAPRLEILRNLPFFIPFETRVQIFRQFVYRDQYQRRNGYIEGDEWRMSVAASQGHGVDGRPRGMDLIHRHHANIRRELVFEDAFESFWELGSDLKEPIQISFIDKFGTPEAGIDGGGVTKEFLMSVTTEAFDPHSDISMFVENEQRFLYPRPTALEHAAAMLQKEGAQPGTDGYQRALRRVIQEYEFIGQIVGKCLYEGILIDVNFAGFFLLKWALTGGTTTASNESAYRASINDVRDFDEDLYQGLLKLKNYSGDVEADFGLNFTVTDTFEVDGDPRATTKDLTPNGSNIAVNNVNRLLYIDKITRYRLQEQSRQVTNAFLRGLSQIISPMWLAMFNQKELQKLIGGDNSELDISDLRRNTQYGGLYVIGDDGLEHPTVSLFWKVLKDMDDKDRRKVLKFVTSTPRAPLLGFSHLNPKFSIRDSSEDQTRLPSTSTCVNLLKLPRYGDEKTMREKLLYAVNAGAGFDLS